MKNLIVNKTKFQSTLYRKRLALYCFVFIKKKKFEMISKPLSLKIKDYFLTRCFCRVLDARFRLHMFLN